VATVHDDIDVLHHLKLTGVGFNVPVRHIMMCHVRDDASSHSLAVVFRLWLTPTPYHSIGKAYQSNYQTTQSITRW